MTKRIWTPENVRDLGVRTDLPTAASVLGLGKNAAYAMARGGTFPVPVLRLGVQYVVPVAPLLHLLGIDADSSETGVATPAVAPHSSLGKGGPRDDLTISLRRLGGAR
jgi:hypothetical protein